MNICPKCGTKGDVKFCPECGTEMVEEKIEVTKEEKVCPNCGYKGDVGFCPECGTKMKELTQESTAATDSSVEISDNTNNAAETSSIHVSTISGISADDKVKDSSDYQPEEQKYVSLSNRLARDNVAVDPEKKEKQKKKIKKTLKIIGIVFGAIILGFIALIIIGTVLQDDFDHDMDSPNSTSINSLKYQYPGNWVVDDSGLDLEKDYYTEGEKYVRWNKDDGTFMARMQIYYLGDDIGSDPQNYFSYLENQTQDRTLSVGGTEVSVQEYDTELENTDDPSTPIDTITYFASFEKDYSDFFVVIDAIPTSYDAEFFDQVIQSIDIEHYKNPRTAKAISAVYTGDNTPGTEVKTGDSNVDVTVEYTNGDKETAEEWELDKDIVIEEGKKSEATVSCHGLTCILEAKGRKPIKLIAKYDGGTKAGTKINKNDLKVTVKYDDGEKENITDFEIDKAVKLKAGETSTIKVKYGDLSGKISIECSTLSKSQYMAKCVNRNYKDQLRKASHNKYIKIYGQVLQDCGYGYFRISSSGGYDDVYMVYAPDSDIVEDDWCTVYGQTAGIYEYETVMGASQKVPEIKAKYIVR